MTMTSITDVMPSKTNRRTMCRCLRGTKIAALLAAGLLAVPAEAQVPVDPTPSTNAQNKLNGWAHVNQLSDAGGRKMQFVSTRNFLSCFEYRSDGDTSQATGSANPNPLITDGLYPFICVSNETKTLTIPALDYIEIRMVFGAEADERFDWTRFDVLGPPNKDACKNGDWEIYGFRNQGQCIKAALGAGGL